MYWQLPELLPLPLDEPAAEPDEEDADEEEAPALPALPPLPLLPLPLLPLLLPLPLVCRCRPPLPGRSSHESTASRSREAQAARSTGSLDP